MSRALSATANASLAAQQTGEVWLVLLTIAGSGFTTIRVANNTEDVVSRGNTFIGFPFEIELPGQDPESPSSARLRIDNIDKRVIEAIRTIQTPPTVTIEVILASAPDTVEIAFTDLSLRGAQYDVNSVRAELVYETIFTEPVTCNITPNRLPGLF